jgi:TetR/AcrR family transcriptional repressor of nem operon
LFLNLVETPVGQLKRGCLLTNSAAEFGTDDPEVAALIRTAYRRMELALTRRLTEAQAQGYLAGSADPKALARLLLTVLQGIRVMARVGTDRQVMRDAVTSALAPIKTKRTGKAGPR